jgi:excisionase family DNA binding protein
MNIEETYQRYLKLTNDPGAAATLVLATVMADRPVHEMLTPKQAATAVGVSVDLIYDLCRDGKLRHQKIGRAIRIHAADLENFDSKPTTKLQCLTI